MTPAASWSPGDFHRAFNRARQAWEATSPQLTIDGWADALDAADAGAVRCVEPACPPGITAAGGFDYPKAYDGPDASSVLGARRGQEGA